MLRKGCKSRATKPLKTAFMCLVCRQIDEKTKRKWRSELKEIDKENMALFFFSPILIPKNVCDTLAPVPQMKIRKKHDSS